MKRLSANDSAGSRVKVGHRQAILPINARLLPGVWVVFEPLKFVNIRSTGHFGRPLRQYAPEVLAHWVVRVHGVVRETASVLR